MKFSVSIKLLLISGIQKRKVFHFLNQKIWIIININRRNINKIDLFVPLTPEAVYG